MFFKKLSFLIISFSLALQAVVPQWHWDSIDTQNLELPTFFTGFKWGVALSEHQVSGGFWCGDNNWNNWECKKSHKGLFSTYPTIETGELSGCACNFWELYPEDIKLVKELGCNAFRISVEWSIIEPYEGQFDQAALEHYQELIRQCNEAGIEVMVTLHHFTHPQWFEDKGGFADEANIQYFVRFCKKVFKTLRKQVKLWCTINEVGPFVFQGYINGAFPPGKVLNIVLAMKVMRCMMLAHCEVYRALKTLPGGYEAQIGIVHQYLPIEMHNAGYGRAYALPDAPTKPIVSDIYSLYAFAAQLNFLERLPAYGMSFFFNDQLLGFLKTGTMFSWIPGLRLDIPDAPECNDFIGLNFYSRVVIKSDIYGVLTGNPAAGNHKKDIVFPSCLVHERMTDMEYGVCPESLYCAIQEIAKLGKPIYITENGAPDGQDEYRELWIRRYLYALSEAIRDGYDVRGYYYWSLMDNFEWDRGYSKKFGLYEVDFGTQERRLRDGAQAYREILQKLACNSSAVMQ